MYLVFGSITEKVQKSFRQLNKVLNHFFRVLNIFLFCYFLLFLLVFSYA